MGCLLFGLEGNGDDKLEVMGGVGKTRLLRDRKASRSGTITIVTYCWAGLGCQVGVVVPFRWSGEQAFAMCAFLPREELTLGN